MTQTFPNRQAGFTHLRTLADRPDGRRITPLFAADPGRATRFTASFNDLSLDFSKSSIDDTALDALFALARTADLDGFRQRLFAGEPVNETEHRAAMHMALRAPADSGLKAIMPGGTQDAATMSAAERDKMQAFVTAIHNGELKGATGQTFTDVMTIGIGGSDLGPKVATEALTIGRSDAKMRATFLSNVDGHAFLEATRNLDPARTLVLVASKTFTTLETSMNAAAARAWIVAALGEQAVASHFAALSTNLKAVAAFGMNPDRVFAFQDWVGGRYSLWSPVGLVIPLAAGWDKFQQMLDGAWAMDCHFRDAPWTGNLPILLGLAGIWNTNALGCATQCILAYDDRLRRLPAHFQQLEMESNGKHVMLSGEPTGWDTCPILFGEPGTNAQHSFMQLVHQGTRPGPGRLHPRRQCRPRPPRCPPGAGRQRLRPGRGPDARPPRSRNPRRDASPRRQPGRHRRHRPAPRRGRRAPVQHHHLQPPRPVQRRPPDRPLRTQGRGPGLPLGHRQLRPMGRRARQAARQRHSPGTDPQAAEKSRHDSSTTALIQRFLTLRGEA